MWMTVVPSDQFEREKLRADLAEARLDKALSALRGYVACEEYFESRGLGPSYVDTLEIARAAIAEIEGEA